MVLPQPKILNPIPESTLKSLIPYQVYFVAILGVNIRANMA
jgi:hypothetical protein